MYPLISERDAAIITAWAQGAQAKEQESKSFGFMHKAKNPYTDPVLSAAWTKGYETTNV